MNSFFYKKNWKSQVVSHYKNIVLTPQKSSELENLLRNAQHNAPDDSTKPSLFALALTRVHNSGMGYFAASLAAAALTFAFMEIQNSKQSSADAIEELASISAKDLPPDFDLDGDASAFQSIVQDLMPSEPFTAEIPQHIQAKFAPSDGRFFTWAGEAAVRIRLVNNKTGEANNTLYIVRLPKNARSQFPLEKTVKNITGKSGNKKRVNSWRDGKYGFALVQYVATNEINPSED